MDYKKELEDAYKSILDAITENFKIHPDLGVKFVKDYNENLEALGKVLNQDEFFLETLGPFASDVSSAISAIKAKNPESFKLLISTIGLLIHAPASHIPPPKKRNQAPSSSAVVAKNLVTPSPKPDAQPPTQVPLNKHPWRNGGKPSSQDGGGGDCGPAAIFASIITTPLAALIILGLSKLGMVFGGAATVAAAATTGAHAGGIALAIGAGASIAASAASWGIPLGIGAGIAIGMCVMMYIKCKIDEAESKLNKYDQRRNNTGLGKRWPAFKKGHPIPTIEKNFKSKSQTDAMWKGDVKVEEADAEIKKKGEELYIQLEKIKNKPIVVAPRGLTANLNEVQSELDKLKSVISEEALNKVLEELEQPFAKESANLVDKAISMFNHLYDEVFNRDKFDVTYHMRLSAAILKFASYLKGLKGLTKEEQDELEFLLIAKLKPSFNRALAYVNYLRVLPSRTDEQVKYAVRVAKQAASMLEYFTDESASLNDQIFNVLSMQAENILPIDAKLVVIYSMHNTNTKETLNTNMIANINLFKKEFIKNFLNKNEKTLPSTIFSEAIVVPFEGKDVEFPPKDYFISFSPEAVEFLNQLRTKKFKINPNAARIIRIFIDTYFNDPTNVEQITNIEQIKIFISITTNLKKLINGLENNTWKDIENPEGGKATSKKYHSTGQKITMTDKSVRTLYKDDKGRAFVKILKNGKMICVPVKKKAARERGTIP